VRECHVASVHLRCQRVAALSLKALLSTVQRTWVPRFFIAAMRRLSAYACAGIGCRLERQGHTVQMERFRQNPAHGCLACLASTEQLRRTVSLQHHSQVLRLCLQQTRKQFLPCSHWPGTCAVRAPVSPRPCHPRPGLRSARTVIPCAALAMPAGAGSKAPPPCQTETVPRSSEHLEAGRIRVMTRTTGNHWSTAVSNSASPQIFLSNIARAC